MQHQTIIWPWESKKWPTIKNKILDKINSIVDMDSRISSMYNGKLRPRQLSELFTAYFSNDNPHKQITQEHFVEKILPTMQRLIENGPKTFRKFVPRTVCSETNLVMNRIQVATCLSCMWFGLFNYPYLKNSAAKSAQQSAQLTLDDFSDPTFINIFINQNLFSLQCLIGYFTKVEEYVNNPSDDVRTRFSAGKIIIKRSVLSESEDWSHSTKPINVKIMPIGVDLQPCKMRIASAHEFIGGEMFGGAISHDELMLLTYPECLVVTLFCSKLCTNDSVVIMGPEKFSKHTGYGSGVRYAGSWSDETQMGYSADETEVMIQTAVVFIDASQQTSINSQIIDNFVRDLDKAYCGFSALSFKKTECILGGNWSYGFNGNNMQIKFIQQVLAAGQSNKQLVYAPFGHEFEDTATIFADWLIRSKMTVGDLFRAYLQLCRDYLDDKNMRRDLDIFNHIMNNY